MDFDTVFARSLFIDRLEISSDHESFYLVVFSGGQSYKKAFESVDDIARFLEDKMGFFPVFAVNRLEGF